MSDDATVRGETTRDDAGEPEIPALPNLDTATPTFETSLMWSDLDVMEATDPELNTFFMAAEKSPEEISAEQYWKFTRLAQPRLGVIEYAYLASKKGTIDDFFWEGILPYTKQLMRKPGYRKFWTEFKADIYHPDFIAFMDDMIADMDG